MLILETFSTDGKYFLGLVWRSAEVSMTNPGDRRIPGSGPIPLKAPESTPRNHSRRETEALRSHACRRTSLAVTRGGARLCPRERPASATRKPPMKIEDYGLIGDTQTAALVGCNGSIDWLCLPRFDSGACFAALLGDQTHGCWQIAPEGEIKASPADATARTRWCWRPSSRWPTAVACGWSIACPRAGRSPTWCAWSKACADACGCACA